jgi:hypothetical protein
MSLASRVANLFSGSSITREQDRSKFEFAGNNGLENNTMFSDAHSRSVELEAGSISQKSVEKEGRPPYMHVSKSTNYVSVHVHC